jgi:hypothetical protein
MILLNVNHSDGGAASDFVSLTHGCSKHTHPCSGWQCMATNLCRIDQGHYTSLWEWRSRGCAYGAHQQHLWRLICTELHTTTFALVACCMDLAGRLSLDDLAVARSLTEPQHVAGIWDPARCMHPRAMLAGAVSPTQHDATASMSCLLVRPAVTQQEEEGWAAGTHRPGGMQLACGATSPTASSREV